MINNLSARIPQYIKYLICVADGGGKKKSIITVLMEEMVLYINSAYVPWKEARWHCGVFRDACE